MMNVAPVAVGCSAFARAAQSTSVLNTPPPLAAQTRCSAWLPGSVITPLLKEHVQLVVGDEVGAFSHPPVQSPHPFEVGVDVAGGAGASAHCSPVELPDCRVMRRAGLLPSNTGASSPATTTRFIRMALPLLWAGTEGMPEVVSAAYMQES